MNANPTEAEAALSALFETKRDAPLADARTAAFERFAAGGLPHRRVEAYKYTDLRARLRNLPPVPAAADPVAVQAVLDGYPALVEGASRIVIANGRFVEALSTTPANVTVRSILDPQADLSGVGTLVADSDDPLTLANVGLFEGGVVVSVDGEAGGPIELVHVATGDNLVMSRVAMTVATEGRVSVVERMLGQAGTVENALTEVTLGEGAHVDWIRLVEGRSEEAVELSSYHVEVPERAQLDHLTVTTGKGLARNQIFGHVVGHDAEANFRAATVAIGKRHADNTLVVRHDAVGSRSSEIFKSAVGDGGTAIVQGRIIVDPDAQKTDSKMMSNALFLDDTGEVVNKPELEIFADDVVCGHGATSGDIDDEPIFYLRARGIPEATARRLLTEAFIIEAFDLVADEALREKLEARIRESLSAVGGKAWTS
ncbi:SufD family Fe-S cluster assembly protein [Acuticoccus sp. I52.16.1]|uniref:SufB/SufD family protein n=1 Tax=Acuticoccus sp. I52.16.1 TaxID=2928472 RepID=UPI001FD51B8A|nr:SufD family Fe-S cluster assembly protein [Acuticoccus sp. I52.16.1]UOM34550.1 SufD family Fe-S cluster assembly protein [Acuticoccus sp. I52.16.1]